MSIPIWFLDVDGVVNALSDRHLPGYERTEATAMGRVWPIQYSPAVVDAINHVHRSGLAEVRWLTTWEQDAHRSLAPAVGLDPFTSYDIPATVSASGWWKADLVAHVISREGRPFVWTDDDLDQHDLDGAPLASVVHRLLCPVAQRGLTSTDLDRITEFTSDMAQARAR